MLVNISRFVMVVALVFLTLAANAASNEGPTCLGEICLDKKSLGAKHIFKTIGKVQPVGKDIVYYCYSVNGGGYFRTGVLQSDGIVVSMLLSNSEACASKGKAKYNLNQFATERGISLGSAEKDVISAYGNPIEILDSVTAYKRWLSDDSGRYYKPEEIDQFWLYGPDTDTSLVRGIGIHQGVVVSILLQASP
jgi:hypothetical protein